MREMFFLQTLKKKWNTLKISVDFKKNTNFLEFLGFSMGNFEGIMFR